jgi:aminoglycoside phosphotransferase (APT) family kinase protein
VNDVEGIKVELAQLKGEVLTELKHLSHDVKGLTMGMQAFVTRREIDEIHTRRKEAHADLEARVDRLEETQTWIFRSILGSWGAAILAAVGFKTLSGH